MSDTTPGIRQRLRETAAQRQERLARLDRRLDALVFLAALLSIPAAAQAGELTGVILTIDVVAWLIFVLEAVVKIGAHGRREYLADRWNWLDISIIVLSAPYHLATGPLMTSLGSLTRLAVLARIALVVVKLLRQGRRLLSRRNVPIATGLMALLMTVTAGLVFVAERAAGNEQFASFGDAMWWSVVTLTTVGYGDISPTTGTGRLGAVFLMVLGVAFLGTVAASLASLFVDEESEAHDAQVDDELADLRDEVRRLRESIEALTARLER